MGGEIVPDGWHRRDLEEVAQIRRGITYTAEMLDSGAGLPYVNMKSFLKGGGFNPSGTKTYSGTFGDDDLIGRQDLLIANTDVTSGDIVGAPALLPHELARSRVLYSHHVTRLRLSPDVLVPFLYYLLCLPEYRRLMLQIARGTTVLMLDMQAIKKLPVRAPREIAEQRRIVKILDTLDEAIRRTEQVIAKLQQMKQGLLHDLLTRGIDEHGELRDPERHPEQFKDSPLGRIPRGWEVADLASQGSFMNGVNKPKQAFGHGTKFVNISDVYPERLNTHGLGRVAVTAVERGRYALVNGDVLIDRSSVKLEGVGYPTVFASADEPVIFCGFIIRFRPNDPRLGVFLCRQMRSTPFRLQVFKVATVSANVNVNQPALGGLLVTLPPEAERGRIVESEAAVAVRLDSEQGHLDKLRTLKHGLMDDLLTGRVRVTVPREAAS